MITKEELQEPRTIDQMDRFIERLYSLISNDPVQVKKARLKIDLYKQLMEEYYPFFLYARWKYKNKGVSCQLVVGNQGFDGIIEDSSGIIERVEVTFPIDGQRENIDARQLNDLGYTEVESYDKVDKWSSLHKRILAGANKKAQKDYLGITLIITFSITPYFDLDDDNDIDRINILVEDLRSIKYRAKSVYIVIPPYQTSQKSFNEVIYPVY